jgi:hypothetical protein
MGFLKMKSKIIPEFGITEQEVQLIISDMATGLVKIGAISAEGKTREQFMSEFLDYLKREEPVFTIDHTEDILKQARNYRKTERNELACLFYALWLEHSINGIITLLAARKDFSEKEIEEIIRDTSYRSKSSWLPRAFGGKSFSKTHINLIVKLMEARNSFVHYKWKAVNEQANNEIKVILSKIEKTVKYIRDYERKHILGVSKKKIWQLSKRA